MTPLTITTNIERTPWSDLLELPADKYLTRHALADVTRIGRLPRGTAEGRSTVNIQLTLADGSVVVGQTTLRLLVSALNVLKSAAELDGEPNE